MSSQQCPNSSIRTVLYCYSTFDTLLTLKVVILVVEYMLVIITKSPASIHNPTEYCLSYHSFLHDEHFLNLSILMVSFVYAKNLKCAFLLIHILLCHSCQSKRQDDIGWQDNIVYLLHNAGKCDVPVSHVSTKTS